MGDFARNWAARQTTGSGTAKAVLGAYAAEADHGDGTLAFPSIERLEALTELNRKTIMAATAHLVKIGLIVDTGRRVGLRRSIKVYVFGQRVPELGLLGDHACASNSTENGTAQALTSPDSGADESQKRDPDSLRGLKKEARAGAGARDPVDKSAAGTGEGRKGLGEGRRGDIGPPAPPGALLAAAMVDDPLAAVFIAWDEMEARHGLPGPVVPDVPRRIAITAGLAAAGLDGCLAIVAAVEASTLISGKRARRHRGQADWEATFDHVFRVGQRFAASRLFDRLLAASSKLLRGEPLEDFAAFAEAELAVADP